MLMTTITFPSGRLPCHREETCFKDAGGVPGLTVEMRQLGLGQSPAEVRTAFWMGDPTLPGLRALSQPPTASPAYQRRLQ